MKKSLLVATAVVAKMSFEFMSPGDTARAAFQVELPPGATISETEDAARRVTRWT